MKGRKVLQNWNSCSLFFLKRRKISFQIECIHTHKDTTTKCICAYILHTLQKPLIKYNFCFKTIKTIYVVHFPLLSVSCLKETEQYSYIHKHTCQKPTTIQQNSKNKSTFLSHWTRYSLLKDSECGQ